MYSYKTLKLFSMITLILLLGYICMGSTGFVYEASAASERYGSEDLSVASVGYGMEDPSVVAADYGNGDLDRDGKITLADAQTALKVALRIQQLSVELLQAADVDGDSSITLSDAQLILKAALKIQSLPYDQPAVSPPSHGAQYILNTNTMKFHDPNCRSVKLMSEENKQQYSGSRDELIEKGYQPCQNCKP